MGSPPLTGRNIGGISKRSSCIVYDTDHEVSIISILKRSGGHGIASLPVRLEQRGDAWAMDGTSSVSVKTI